MIPINNSDLAWLITADYNQDNAIGYPDCLRDDIANPDINDWHYVYNDDSRVGGMIIEHVGTAYIGDNEFVGGSDYVVGDAVDPGVGSDEGYIGG